MEEHKVLITTSGLGSHKDSPPERLIVEVSGHYCFTKEPFRSALVDVKEKLSKHLFDRFDEICGAWE